MKPLVILCTCLLYIQASPVFAQDQAESTAVRKFDAKWFKTMKWRNIGPFRGGRSTTVCGVVQDDRTFYMGTTGGGVWKTTNGGHRWKNISDGYLNTGSVGAVAVAPSDPNVIYVGTGEAPVRGVMTSSGDGVYKSTDAGQTWQHLGLEASRQISAIRIHPDNPDLVWVAVQGSPYRPAEMRGIYRSEDGGKNWDQVLFVNATSGASDLSLDLKNPRMLYAAFWDHQRHPWKIRSGGAGSSIWKSSDGGTTWEKLEEGLPKQLMGKIGVAVSPAAPNRVYAIIESEEGGLYRSDNGGKKWKLINADRVLRARSWYYMHVFADPQKPNTVYVLNSPMMRSDDGGKTFRRIRTPHGDNHALWIHPDDPNTMINGNDGGANITYNGGSTWSTQSNQPTAQFYRVNADNQFPYHVYGGQQDNSTVAIPSRTDGRGIRNGDFYSVGGCESAYCAFDPDNPRFVYAGCYQGIITEYDTRLKTGKDIMVYPYLGLGERPADLKYRFNWNAPIVVSKHDPKVIYHAGNVLFKSTNRGISWEAISPDLTRDIDEKKEWGGGPITNEGAGGENYHTIMYVAESERDPDELWVGTDDGRVHLTRDGGNNWTEVTPPRMKEGIVNTIALDPHNPGRAWLAFTRYKFDDFTPYIYRTGNYGKSWSLRAEGIDENAHVRVVRADPGRKDLLFAGTERGLYLSYDAGQEWHKFQLNLPVVPITDLKVHQGDLIAATQGRAFWILDDLTPLQAFSTDTHVQFFPVRSPVLWGGPRIDTLSDMGTNPDPGMVASFFLPDGPDTLEAVVQIEDENGNLLRTFSTSAEQKNQKIKLNAHLNQVKWDLRRAPFKRPVGLMGFGGTNGPLVGPGQYTLRIRVGTDSTTLPFNIRNDPRASETNGDHTEKQALLQRLHHTISNLYQQVQAMQYVRDQMQTFQARKDIRDSTIMKMSKEIVSAIDSLESRLVQVKQKTFQDVINFPNQLDAKLIHIQNVIDQAYPPVTEGQRKRVNDLMAEWAERESAISSILQDKLNAFNAQIRNSQIPYISPELPVSKQKNRS